MTIVPPVRALLDSPDPRLDGFGGPGHVSTIMIARGNLDLEAEVSSDTRALTPLVAALTGAVGDRLRFVRGPTRGGAGTVLNEPARMVLMHTRFGGTRMIDMLVGDPLPRIC